MSLLIALDFDGTSDDRGDVPLVHPLVQQALGRAVRRGWRWALISDRSRGELLRVVTSLVLHLRPAAIVAQSRVIELRDHSGDYRSHFRWNAARAREHELLAKRLAPHVGEWVEAIRASFRVRVELLTDGSFGFVVYPEDVPALRGCLASWAADIPDAAVTTNHESASIIHRNFCKGSALREVAAILDVGPQHVCAIGDAPNDLPMLRPHISACAGCPANAAPEVRSWVTQRRGGYLASFEGARGTAEVLDIWTSSQSQPPGLSMRDSVTPSPHERRPRVMMHSYGLLDKNRDIIAGSRMSGLSLYTTLLGEGLTSSYSITLVCGSLNSVDSSAKRVHENLSILEYDARFSPYLEHDGVFDPSLAEKFYKTRVADHDNPIYEYLASVYARAAAAVSPDLVNTHNPNAACAAIHAVLRGVQLPPIVATVHDVHPIQLEFLAHHQEKICRFVAISNSVREALCSAGVAPNRIRMIPNGIELGAFFQVADVSWSDVARKHDLPKDEAFTVFVPARRARGKGIDVAIRAFDLLAGRRSERMRLIISGAGLAEPTYETELHTLARSVSARDSIFFLGNVSYSQMPGLFRVSDISLLPSTDPEGFGYANIEAMATGGPVVVSSAHGGPLDYIRHRENGLLVPPHDAESLANTLEGVLSTPGVYASLKATAKETARQYTREAMLSAYHKCLQAVLREGGST